MTNVRRCSTDELAQALADDDCQVIDVREPAEYRSEYIEGTLLAPLSRFERHQHELDHERPVHVVCRSGTRAAQAAERLVARGCRDVRVVEGGLTAWVSEGRAVEWQPGGAWSLERQVRFGAGAVVFASVAAGFAIHPAFAIVAGAAGGGLMFAGATDTCFLGMVLARMPWNRAGEAEGCSVGAAAR